MMTQEQRAKQFMPFDAMKGLQEALRDREERHSRVERHDISEEEQEQNSKVLCRIKNGSRVEVNYYCHFHDVVRSGTITAINIPYHFLILGDEKIFFEDIYKGFNINEIYAKRMINANAKGRGEISELLITNYEEMEECIQENSILKKVASN